LHAEREDCDDADCGSQAAVAKDGEAERALEAQALLYLLFGIADQAPRPGRRHRACVVCYGENGGMVGG
jgi:hypothetical protein